MISIDLSFYKARQLQLPQPSLRDVSTKTAITLDTAPGDLSQ
jgi:hypothetical protein